MIGSCIRRLCALSILCGAALSISPEGSAKRVMNIVCAAALLCAVIQPLAGMDFSEYALELARTEQRRGEFLENSGEINDRLNRLVIQGKYEAYIMDKAAEFGIPMTAVRVEVRWNAEGLWVPDSAKYTCSGCGETEKTALVQTVEAELGIPAERQQWGEDE